jgi:hypothetical protein
MEDVLKNPPRKEKAKGKKVREGNAICISGQSPIKWMYLTSLPQSQSDSNNYRSGEYAASPFADENQRYIDNASGQQAVRYQ